MRHLWLLLLLFVPCGALAQDAKQEDIKSRTSSEQVIPRPGAGRNFWLMSGLTVAATVFDIESTFASLKRGAKEGNPIMRPFVKRGRPAAYAFGMGIDTAVMYLAYRYKQRWVKKWWLTPLVLASSQAIAGSCNLRFTIK